MSCHSSVLVQGGKQAAATSPASRVFSCSALTLRLWWWRTSTFSATRDTPVWSCLSIERRGGSWRAPSKATWLVFGLPVGLSTAVLCVGCHRESRIEKREASQPGSQVTGRAAAKIQPDLESPSSSRQVLCRSPGATSFAPPSPPPSFPAVPSWGFSYVMPSTHFTFGVD